MKEIKDVFLYFLLFLLNKYVFIVVNKLVIYFGFIYMFEGENYFLEFVYFIEMFYLLIFLCVCKEIKIIN